MVFTWWGFTSLNKLTWNNLKLRNPAYKNKKDLKADRVIYSAFFLGGLYHNRLFFHKKFNDPRFIFNHLSHTHTHILIKVPFNVDCSSVRLVSKRRCSGQSIKVQDTLWSFLQQDAIHTFETLCSGWRCWSTVNGSRVTAGRKLALKACWTVGWWMETDSFIGLFQLPSWFVSVEML